jgi:hypothetical protein
MRALQGQRAASARPRHAIEERQIAGKQPQLRAAAQQPDSAPIRQRQHPIRVRSEALVVQRRVSEISGGALPPFEPA